MSGHLERSAGEVVGILLCDCGDPTGTREWWVRLLRWYVWTDAVPKGGAEAREYYLERERIFATLFPDPEHPSTWAVLYVLDGLGLTAHGGGVRGGWLRELGREVLAELEGTGVPS